MIAICNLNRDHRIEGLDQWLKCDRRSHIEAAEGLDSGTMEGRYADGNIADKAGWQSKFRLIRGDAIGDQADRTIWQSEV